MQILRLEKLQTTINVQPGDSFRLSVDGAEVHRADIATYRTITHWALVEVAGGLGYFIGDERLEQTLKSMCS